MDQDKIKPIKMQYEAFLSFKGDGLKSKNKYFIQINIQKGFSLRKNM